GRSLEKSLLAADLNKLHAVRRSGVIRGNREPVKAAVGGVQQPEAILPRLDFEIGEDCSVYKDRASVVLGDPGCAGVTGDWIENFPILAERAVEEHERDFVGASRQSQRNFQLVSDEIHARQAGNRVQPCNAHRMIVVEQSGRFLLIRVVTGRRLAGHEPVFGIAIAIGRGSAAMQMYYSAYLGLVLFRSVNRVIDGQKMPLWQLVCPLDQDGLLTPYFERGSRAR